VSPTAVGEEKGRDGGGILGCVEGGTGESGQDGGRILGASREAVGSWVVIHIFSTILYIYLFFKRN
jgi:hypothetical protein